MFKQVDMRLFFLVVALLSHGALHAQDSFCLKVHFLYGSKPSRDYKKTESRWFGGLYGGHVGIELDSDRIINFLPNGRFHLLTHKKNRHSRYEYHTNENFYSILGGEADSAKKLIIYIRIGRKQKSTYDSLCAKYTSRSPYDYALLGMRCGAAAYDILTQLNILPKSKRNGMALRIPYPKILRKKLIEKASKNNWRMQRFEGTKRRIWEVD